MTHELKILPEYYDAIRRGVKRFEIRKNNRDFQAGDVLWLKEWDGDEEQYTGNEMVVRVLYVLYGNGDYGLTEGYCIMSIVDPETDIIQGRTDDKVSDKAVKTSTYKIVTVKHPNCNTPYTFSVPERLNLDAGDYVLCDTKTHAYPQVAQCITPSFRVSEDILKGLLNIAPTKLRPIVAHLSVEWCREEKTEDAE